MCFLICERAECDGCDIRGADEGDLAVRACGIDLTLVLDRSKILAFGEVLYSFSLAPTITERCAVSYP